MASRAHRELLPRELRLRRRKLFIWKIIAMVFGVLICAAGVILVLRMDRLRITDVYIEGRTETSDEKIRDIVFDAIAGAYAFVIPKNSILLVSDAAIAAAIHTHAPEVENVEVRRSGTQSLTVSVSGRSPSALWCGGDGEAFRPATPCYFVDKEAIIFSRAFPDDPQLRVGSSTIPLFAVPLRDTSRSPLGTKLIDPSVYATLITLAATMTAEGFPVKSFAFSGDDIALRLENGVQALLPRGSAINDAARNLLLVLSSEDFMRGDDIDYIDLRFGNKVFYKEK